MNVHSDRYSLCFEQLDYVRPPREKRARTEQQHIHNTETQRASELGEWSSEGTTFWLLLFKSNNFDLCCGRLIYKCCEI